MALVVKLGNTYRPVTLKSTALMIIVSLFTAVIISLIYELFGKNGHVCLGLSAFCLTVAVDSFFSPVREVYYRYPALAVVLSVLLVCIPLIFGRHERAQSKIITTGLSQENLFAIIAVCAGLIVAVMLPVSSYNSWDDETHYHRIAYMSQGIYATETEADIDLIYSPYIKANSQEQIDFEKRLNVEEKTEKSVVSYSDPKAFFADRIGYLGILLFTWLGRLLKLSFTVRYTLGRVGNLFMYVFIMYFAIKHLHKGKTFLTVLALSTTAVFLSANYSYDPWVFALSALSFSYFFTAIDCEEKLTNREIIIMIGSLTLAVLPKMPYAFLLLFLLLMPKTKFETQNQRRIYFLAIILIAFAIVLLTYISTFGTGNVADIRFSDEPVSAIEQLKLIIEDPVSFIKLLGSFLITYLNPMNYGPAFTSMGLISEGKYTFIYLIVALFCTFYDSVSSRAYIRITGTIICIAMAAGLAVVFYLIYTPVGKNFIAGCQYRYLVPMVFPAFTLLFGGYIKNSRKSLALDYIPIAVVTVILTINLSSVLI